MISIYKTAQIEVEDSEAWRLAQQFPHAVSHDTTNTVFIEQLPDAVNPYMLPETNAEDEPLSIDQQAVLAAVWLFNQAENAMHLTRSQAIALFNHPAHRLWVAKYILPDESLMFEYDYSYVGVFIEVVGSTVEWPDFTEELTPEEAHAYMVEGLSAL